jgi:hypothetical protein
MAKKSEEELKLKVELKRIEVSASVKKFGQICTTIKYIFGVICVLGSIAIIMYGIQPFSGSNPESLNAIAHIIKNINFLNSSSYVMAFMFGGGWYFERRGKKRAIAKKGEYQKKVEQNDLYRSSSCLTESGDTPEGSND